MIGGDNTITAYMNKIILLTLYQRHVFFQEGGVEKHVLDYSKRVLGDN